MAFFAMPYRVLFQDTMAYGSHHFLTNFKFQCEVREHFYFTRVSDLYPDNKDVQNLVLLTQEGYTRNLAPVLVGERVGILLTIEEHTRSSVRMCFRVVRQDGKPVCCGYQSMVCTSRQGNVVTAPLPLLYALAPIRERLRGPSFQERVLAGGVALKALFDEEAIRVGTAMAREQKPQLMPDVLLPPSLLSLSDAESRGVVFTFPGQGSWEPRLLEEVCQLDPGACELLTQADAITHRLLGAEVRSLVYGNRDEAAATLECCPDLVQVAAYLTSVLSARYLIAGGITPHLLLGHSVGELAALAVAGAVDFATGLELVCHRVRILQAMNGTAGGMVALSCDEKQAQALLKVIGAGSLEISVLNGPHQTVVSGSIEDLQRLTKALPAQQVSGSLLKSRYAFHSRLLREAVVPFRAALEPLTYRPLTIPVYSPMERGLLTRHPDLPRILPAHFVEQLAFPEALEDAFALGGRVFIECGGGRVLTGLAQRAFRDWAGVSIHALSPDHAPGELARLVQTYGKGHPVPPVVPAEAAGTSTAPQSARRASDRAESPDPLPIAIVSLGCVLPGAANADTLWRNLLAGKGGIIDVAKLDPTLAADFRCERPVRPDKTYSLLTGRATSTYGPEIARHYGADEWANLEAVSRFLAEATTQCLSGLKSSLPSSERICCVLGSTGDGSADHDEVLLLAALEEIANAGSAPAVVKEALCQALEQTLNRTLVDAGERVPYRGYSAVARRLLGNRAKVLAVDAACASSLYAIAISMRALRDGQYDLAVCGGVFAPGVANTCLFAQFQGLSATGSRPLDASADGVVFGEGAALIVLKRLPDALAAGDPILAVIRAVGTSSDGKSPSVMEPRKEGQLLAMRRAAARCGVPLSTLQYIDAHATGTPVGDAVEFASLCEAVGPRPAGQPPIRLGSLKALLGHTGWAAGAASVIALCKALEHQTLPPQPNFATPNPHFGLERSPFVISTEPTPWPVNAADLPRRAGVNGFGFGGCDAHLILEQFKPDYHHKLSATPPPPPEAEGVVIVEFSALFPASRGPAAAGTNWKFSPVEVRLPNRVRILPDVADHMDRSHILAVRAAEEVVSRLSEVWAKLRTETGIIVGFGGKTRRGIEASLRVYADHLRRRLAEINPGIENGDGPLDLLRDELFEAVRRITPSGPYTLPGLMPNVMAGRVANAFNITGPNLVLDADRLSLYHALREAERLLRFREARFVLAGGIGSCAGADVDRVRWASSQHDTRPTGEAVVMVGLMLPAAAHELGLPVLGRLSFSPPTDLSQERLHRVGAAAPVCLLGAEGAVELAGALELIRRQGGSAAVEWTDAASGQTFGLTLTSERAASVSPPQAPKSENLPEEVASLLAVPVRWMTPRWMRENVSPSAKSGHLDMLPVLIVTDQPTRWMEPESQTILSKWSYRLVCPASAAIPGAVAIDLSSTSAMEQSLRQLDGLPYEAVLVLKDLRSVDALESVTGSANVAGGLIELLFAVVRHGYQRLERGLVSVGALCLHGAVGNESLHPYTGLVSGFLRSLVRELPRAVCKQVNTADGDLASAIPLLEAELGQGTPAWAEVSYFRGERYVAGLMELAHPSTGKPLLGPESVVVVVGGARGITAVLAEALLSRFACTLVLLGRTDPEAVPLELLSLDEEGFERFEPEFYQRELAKEQGARMPELKQRYDGYRSAREAAVNLRRLRTLSKKVSYLRVDVTDEAAVDEALRQVAEQHGRLDMVLHGAGIQTSKVLARKKLEEFRAILTTKLGGLGNLMRACQRHFPGRRIHFHPITSTFSEIGNAGQQDYGAANVAMDRVAQHLGAGPGPWEGSSLGWLGWLGVGMTRGSEYATLAIKRRLRPIPRAEGGALFSRFLSGRPVTPTMHLISEQEASFFGLTIQPSDAPAQAQAESATLKHTLVLDLKGYPFFGDHLLNGVPTLPGAFAVDLAVCTVRTLRPGMHVKHLAGVSIERFIKFPEGKPFTLRAVAEVVEESTESARIAMRFLSDFVHADGRVLQTDIVHFSAEFLLTAEPQPVVGRGALPLVRGGWRLPDPYLHPAGPLNMDGPFLSLHDIRIGPTHSTATFRPRDSQAMAAVQDTQIPFVLLDALWRFSAILRDEDGSAVLCVPLRCGILHILPGVNHRMLADQECSLACSAPRQESDHILVDWAEATDSSGRVLFAVQDIVGRVYGRVPAQAELLAPLRMADRELRTEEQNGKDRSLPSNSQFAIRNPQSGNLPFERKVALVTGSGRGIGKVIAERLADLGAQVIVNSFHSRELGEETTAEILARGGKAVHLWGSVANLDHLRGIFREIDSRFGGLDFFVSNASAGVFAPLTAVTPEHWDRCFRTNVMALHQGSLLAAELMRKRGGGKIVALSSVGADLCFDYFGCVGPVKAAVECLVRYLAVELAPDGIQVNTVTAGPVAGDLLNGYVSRPRWERLTPRQRLLSEEETAEPVLFLLAQDGMNGTTLVVDAAGRLRICEPVS
jgi:acyl transferase domain-containing protein/NAD(P)-dependent dehydrogenase (short-subunit alcohol dehydrogenase family)/acyl-CoA thioesterase FadM